MKRGHRIFIFSLTLFGALQSLLWAQPPVITNQPASRAVWPGGNVAFAVGVSGAGPFTYQWQLNGTNLTNGIMTTVAGNGTTVYSGDGGPATNASLNIVTCVAVDASNNLLISDYNHQRIRMVNTGSVITTIAGKGGNGSFTGDGGAATNATLNSPASVVVDAAGNFFIADEFNQRIRKVQTNGIITTVAGNGTSGYFGDGGAATNANLKDPSGMALDASGNLFIADFSNNRIRKVDTNGVITTVAGNGNLAFGGDGGPATNASLANPQGVIVDGTGNIFIADTYNARIRKVATNGLITTIAGNGTAAFSGDGGAATNASLQLPTAVALDDAGNLFIADTSNNRIREVSTNGIISTVAGNGTTVYSGDGVIATNLSLNSPYGLTADAFGNLFIGDTLNNRVRKVTNTRGYALALNNVDASVAGNYRVVVTGSGGSITSSVARLTVASSPFIFQVARSLNSNLTLNLVSQPGTTNIVLGATNLSQPVWQPLTTNISAPDGTWQYIDTNTAGNPKRFYRSLTH